jgi:GNAT superfamily N-acetyltransferase
MRRDLGDGYELDDDPARIDRDAVHRFLTAEAYWALGRSRRVVDETLDSAARVVGLYQAGEQIGFVRVVSDRHTVAYVADVYVLPEHRGRGLGVELFRFAVLEGPIAHIRKWGLHTRDAHELYRRFGFGDPDDRYMERWNLPPEG